MWTILDSWAIGGLLEIGFFEKSDYLMILSSQGRGIFDCLNNEKVERDHFDYYYNSWNDKTGIVKGIGRFENESTLCGGFEYENILSQETSDGWRFRIEERVIKQRLRKNRIEKFIILFNPKTKENFQINISHYHLNRGIGFSETGNTFVFATSSDVHFVRRKALFFDKISSTQSTFKILHGSWGIRIQILGKVNRGISKEKNIILDLNDISIKLSSKEINYLNQGLEWVKPFIKKKINNEIIISIEEINLVLTDYQAEGLYYAIAYWASEYFAFELPKFDYRFNKKENRYEFPGIGV